MKIFILFERADTRNYRPRFWGAFKTEEGAQRELDNLTEDNEEWREMFFIEQKELRS